MPSQTPTPQDAPRPAGSPRSPEARMARRTALAVTAATVLLLIVVAGAALTGDWSTSVEPAPTMTVETVPPTQEPADIPLQEPLDDGAPNESVNKALRIAMSVVGALVAAFLLYRLGLWIRRTLLPWLATRPDRPVDAGPQPAIDLEVVPLTVLRKATAHAETLLREGEHSTDAIIAAWLALEDAAVRSGATRAPAQTPTEFTVAVLGATPASPEAVTDLLGLYHLARFAHADMTAAQVAAAGAALRRLTEDFSRVVTPTPEGGPAHEKASAQESALAQEGPPSQEGPR